MTTAYQPLERAVVAIEPQFLAQYPVDLTVATKLMSIGECNLGVTDVNETLIFKVKSKLLSIRDRRYLLDAVGNRLATLQQKVYNICRGSKETRWIGWKALPERILKLNVDGALTENGSMGVGGVVRDSSSSWLVGFMAKLWLGPQVAAELHRIAMQICWDND